MQFKSIAHKHRKTITMALKYQQASVHSKFSSVHKDFTGVHTSAPYLTFRPRIFIFIKNIQYKPKSS